jgi:hypothetical protein
MKNFMIESRCSGFLRKSPRLLVATHLQSISREDADTVLQEEAVGTLAPSSTLNMSAIPTV